MQNLIFITYDGIENPVFCGQVVQPLLAKLRANPELKICLISFEKKYFSTEEIEKYVPKNRNLTFIIFKRYPVLGKITLWHSTFLLKKFLKKFENYDFKARSPFAGLVGLNAIDYKKCKSFTIQARGLIAVEYDMFYSKQNKIKLIFHEIRKKIFNSIEQDTYKPKKIPDNFCIESVSPALSDYLISHFGASIKYIKIASQDIPQIIDPAQIKIWRNQIRKELQIADDAHIYCYNGSTKPWQSIDLTINYFREKLSTNKNIFLLVLTQDVNVFQNLLNKENIDKKSYKILNVKHHDIYKYLSACDTGLLFRKQHLANWISRPIKAMEYQAVNLKIVHNNTVKWLIDLGK